MEEVLTDQDIRHIESSLKALFGDALNMEHMKVKRQGPEQSPVIWVSNIFAERTWKTKLRARDHARLFAEQRLCDWLKAYRVMIQWDFDGHVELLIRRCEP